MKSLLILLTCSALSLSAHAVTYRFSKLGGATGGLIATDVTPAGVPFLLGGTVPGSLAAISLGEGLSLDAGVLSASGGDLTDYLTIADAEETYQTIIADGSLALAKLATDPLARANHTGSQDWSTITGEPTTMNGYGIAGPNSPYQTGIPLWMGGFTGWTNDGSASTIRDRIGLNLVENTALSTWAGSTNLTTLGTVSAGAIPTSLLTGSISNAQLANSSITINGSAVSLGGSTTISTGLTINTTTTSGASAGDILTSDGTKLQKITPSASVTAALPNATNASGGFLDYGIIGTSGAKVPLLNAVNTFSATLNTRSLIPSADDTYTLGAQFPGFRWKQAFFSDSVSSLYYIFGGGGYIYPVTFNSKVGFRFTPSNGTDASPLLLGAADATHPALDSSGYTFIMKKGDNTAGGLQTGEVTATVSLTVGGGGAIKHIKRASGTMVAGSLVITDAATTANSHIEVMVATPGGTVGFLSVTVSAGVGYTITSSSASDTSALVIKATHF